MSLLHQKPAALFLKAELPIVLWHTWFEFSDCSNSSTNQSGHPNAERHLDTALLCSNRCRRQICIFTETQLDGRIWEDPLVLWCKEQLKLWQITVSQRFYFTRGKIRWGGQRGKVTVRPRVNFITAESTTTASCCLPYAGITAALPPLCSIILTVVTEGTPLFPLDTLWGPLEPGPHSCGIKAWSRVPETPALFCQRCPADIIQFSWTLGSCPTWSKRMCAASLSAAVTVGGKVKAMKCLGSNQAWLKQSPLPGQEANFMQLTREDEGKRRGRAPWTLRTQQPNCTTLPSVHNNQSTDEKDKEWYHT